MIIRSCLLFIFLFCGSLHAQYITLKDKQFYDQNGDPFFPMVMNYHVDIVHDQLPNPQFKVVRYGGYGTQGCALSGGYTWANCETSLDEDFTKIKQMGFNSIRLLVAPRRKNGSLGFVAYSHNFSSICNSSTDFTFDFDPSTNYNSANNQIFFNLVAHMLDIAHNNDIKVILLCSDGSSFGQPDRGSSDIDALDYAQFLTALASYLYDKPALLAYDLYNEPHWNVGAHSMVQHKEKVCDYVEWWYDAIKVSDQNHLITIGGCDMGDVLDWDDNIMKLDFISMHFYPFAEAFESYDMNKATERMLNMIAWCSSALQKPWIIGETGFSTAPDACINSFPGASDGTYSDQYNFISTILPALRDCGASGFSWWEFMDVHYYCIPSFICSSCSYCNICTGPPSSVQDVHGNYWGLLQYSDPVNGVYPSTAVKDGAAYTTTFDPNAIGTCATPTSNYYNPHQYPSSAGTISGTVLDDNGQPIKDAVIIAHTDVFYPNETPRNEYTFTDATGFFQLIPAPNGTQTTVIKNIAISAFGASKASRGWNGIPITNNEVFTLTKRTLVYDEIINNQTVNTGNNKSFKGWNSLTTSNITIETGATSELKARDEIHVTASFSADYGSEVHIKCEPIFADCGDFSGSQFQRQSSSAYTNTEMIKSNIIEVAFRKSDISNSVKVYPNPTKGTFAVELSSDDENNIIHSVDVYDIMNRKVSALKCGNRKIDINFSTFPKGIYFLLIYDSTSTFYHKIILI